MGRPRLGRPKPYRDKEWLEDRFDWPISVIAQEAGVSESTIREWMGRFDLLPQEPQLPPLTERHDPRDKVWHDLKFLRRTKDYTLRAVAKAAGCSAEMIRLARIRHRIES